MSEQRTHEPFSQTWTGIAMQVFIVLVLLYVTIALWTR
jgi:hypothetical protein